ncbi:uncharacterized protein DMAD_11274 [Drosophila madeirensis]|uniref:Secreted protein n=1 Tax=Drosophila madeirensis TaxID=30013 RepID=A0AAU9FCJ8_DROMD|nr:uncharacterized protein LOC117900607 isoform X2 [Drosophila subobscura]
MWCLVWFVLRPLVWTLLWTVVRSLRLLGWLLWGAWLRPKRTGLLAIWTVHMLSFRRISGTNEKFHPNSLNERSVSTITVFG